MKDLASRQGFSGVGTGEVRLPEEDQSRFEAWCQSGRNAGMGWLSRNPRGRSDVKTFWPQALGVLSLAAGYGAGEVPPRPKETSGRVARFAWGQDYHRVMREKLTLFCGALKEIWPGLETCLAVDAQPLLERAFALRAGMGARGQNALLLLPNAGSWFFLGEILVNRPLVSEAAVPPECAGCLACHTHCPVGALDVPGGLDARRCLAYHTTENRGWIPADIRPLMGLWVFGCDECQEVCPENDLPRKNFWPEFEPGQGVGAWVPLKGLLSTMTEATFQKKFFGTSLLRAKREGLVRNACVAAGNSGDESLVPLLKDRCQEDPSPIVRGHAAWALARLGQGRWVNQQVGNDPDEKVRQEMSEA